MQIISALVGGPHLAKMLRLINKCKVNLLGLENTLQRLPEHILFS